MVDAWTQKADFASGKTAQRAMSISTDTKGYVITGLVNGSWFTVGNWEYNPVSDIWTQKADFIGSGRYSAAGFQVNNKVYVGTGTDKHTPYTKDFYEYNPSNNTWSNKTSFPGIGRRTAFCFTIGSKGYIGMGYVGPGAGGQLQDFYEYNPSNNTWTQKADFNGLGSKRSTGSSFAIQSLSKGYICFGSYNIGSAVYPKDTNEYDPNTNTWVAKANVPASHGRVHPIHFAIGIHGFAGTGWNGATGNKYQDVYKYDSVNNTWSSIQDYPLTLFAASSFSISDKGYGVGGSVAQSTYEWCCGIAIATISGLVSDGVNPIQGAIINAINGTSYSTTTIANGTYSLTVDYDVYVVTASKSKYLDSSASVDASAGDQTQNFVLLKPVISGNVKNSNGINLPSVAISLEDDIDYSTITDGNGDYSQTVDTDIYDVVASIPGNADQSAIVDASTADQTQDFIFPITTAPHDKAIRLKERYLLE